MLRPRLLALVAITALAAARRPRHVCMVVIDGVYPDASRCCRFPLAAASRTHLHPPANHLAGGEGRGFATGADLERVRDNYPSAEDHGPAKAHVRHVLSVGGTLQAGF